MENKEDLILPEEFGRVVVPWPFTPFGRSLDRLLRERGFELLGKAVLQHDQTLHNANDRFEINRVYKLNDIKILDVRHVLLPAYGDETEKGNAERGGLFETFEFANLSNDESDFHNEEVTWDRTDSRNIRRLVSPKVLVRALKDQARGIEDLEIEHPRYELAYDIQTQGRGRGLIVDISGHLFDKDVKKYLVETYGLGEGNFKESPFFKEEKKKHDYYKEFNKGFNVRNSQLIALLRKTLDFK
jgi:hypothetical protein